MLELILPNWPAPQKIKSVLTTRKGGVSKAPWDSFNLATHVEDDIEHVKQNREKLQKAASLPEQPQWLNQTHSINVVDLSRDQERHADAAFTSKANQVAVVLTADCLPILLCNQQATEVAAIHAGWRGLADGIVIKTIDAMRSDARNLMAWIGPAISQPNFEVGEEVKQLFCDRYSYAEQFFRINERERFQADTIGLVKQQLNDLGLSQIYGGDQCSYADKDLFYSYRREGLTGRMASLIWIEA